ncbi:MAG TPA: acyl-CoA dehydrogenase family protein [Candidatus Binataceae bacterium]|nr:acyl-CoA dehydrogenase family protein [Candidatus Binataceae bacterium]
MKPRFPAAREEKRAALMSAVEDVRAVLAAEADEAEKMRTLPPASVAALRDSGLLALKLPEVLGGAEADPVLQSEVFEAVSYINPAAGWCLFIGSASIGMAGAFLPDTAIARMFAGERVPTAAAALMPGRMTAVKGGYRLSGRWSWGSGIRHAEWVLVSTKTTREGGTIEPRIAVVPTAGVEIIDNWHVMGLGGTGSCDFATSELFVPEEFTYPVAARPNRGGPLYRLGMPGFVTNEIPAFAIGVGRRALDEVMELARSKSRGYRKPISIAGRAAFQRMAGESDLKLRAARALANEVAEKSWRTVCEGRVCDPRMQAEMRAAGVMVMEAALEVATGAFRFGAGSAVRLENVLQRCFRDLQTASAHYMVSDTAFETYGQYMLGVPAADPLD